MKLSALNAKKEQEMYISMLDMLTECHTFADTLYNK